jgi:hypothetical protein
MRVTTAVILCFMLMAATNLSHVEACTVFAVRDNAGSVYTINQEDWGGDWAGRKPAETAILMVPSAKHQLTRLIFSCPLLHSNLMQSS